jgi:predicted Zn-dependent protease
MNTYSTREFDRIARAAMPRTAPDMTAPEAEARPRFLSEADCHDLVDRLTRYSTGGGYTCVTIRSVWRGSIRWARNQVSTSTEVKTNDIHVLRNIRGSAGRIDINETTDAALVAASRDAERLVALGLERPNSGFVSRLPLELVLAPDLFSDATYQLDADQRAAAALALTQDARAAGMLSAGYIEVAAVSLALLDTLGRVRYFPYTQAQYSVTVRDPKGTSSGWAGLDHHDWGKIDASTLTARALDKCIKSQHPVAVEPGRYTTILEPQAVGDLVGQLFFNASSAMDRPYNEEQSTPLGPFHQSPPTATRPGLSKIGEKIIDERLTISADPMDPELGFPPFAVGGVGDLQDQFTMPVYHPATWIDHGVLTNLAYSRAYSIQYLNRDTGLPNSGAFRMSGGTTTIEEMIATTKRGILVTRFDDILQLDLTSQLYRGYTRDGLWLIEHGKISKAIKNLAFTESVLFALNNVEQLGVPQRVFHPNVAFTHGIPQPVVVPPLKVRDFSFTSLVDAV